MIVTKARGRQAAIYIMESGVENSLTGLIQRGGIFRSLIAGITCATPQPHSVLDC